MWAHLTILLCLTFCTPCCSTRVAVCTGGAAVFEMKRAQLSSGIPEISSRRSTCLPALLTGGTAGPDMGRAGAVHHAGLPLLWARRLSDDHRRHLHLCPADRLPGPGEEADSLCNSVCDEDICGSKFLELAVSQSTGAVERQSADFILHCSWQVVPSEVGQQRQPPYFFLLPSFWRARRDRNTDEKLLAHWCAYQLLQPVLVLRPT